MSLVSLLSIARSALLAHQRAMSVTAHNVANAQTPGYSRQRLQLSAETPLLTAFGTVGRGVTDLGVTRARDRFYDATYWRESAQFGDASARVDYWGRVEAAMSEPSDSGLASAIDGLFSSFADLANEPTSGTNREMVRQAGSRLIRRFNELNTQIDGAQADAAQRMRAQVDEVNALTERIAELNTQIVASGGPGHSAPDLMDQRDVLVDRLSERLGLRVLEREDGSIALLSGGTTLVDGSSAQRLGVVASGGGMSVSLEGDTNPLSLSSGSLAALTTLSTTDLPALRARLDELARTMVTEVNAVHRTGYNADGGFGLDFFDPAGLTAGTIRLSSAVTASAGAVALGNTPDPGNNSVALRLSTMGRDAFASLGNKSLREYYVEMATSVGMSSSGAIEDQAAHGALLDRADLQRASVSGVSVEEEMTNLIQQQQAYGAAARLVRAAEEMMDTLLREL